MKLKTGQIVTVGMKDAVYLYRNHNGKYVCQEPLCYLRGYIMRGVMWFNSVERTEGEFADNCGLYRRKRDV